ncbi:MAG: BACON domain-containing protein [Bacteroidales bacterium]
MRKIPLFLLVLLFSINIVFGQDNVSRPIVQAPIYFDVSPPLRDMANRAPGKAETSWKDGIVKNKFNVRPRIQGQAPGGLTDPAIQTMNGMLMTDTTIANFEGNSNTEGYTPPDTHGDVGPNHYFQTVNCHFSIYSKTGALLIGPLANSSVFAGLPNNSNDGDAVVLYDEQADRWLFSQFSLPNYPNGPFYQMVAISATPDPTGSWYRYQYSFANMPDYPKFGVWPDAYYMSMHMFASGSGAYAGTGAVAYNRTLMLAGSPSATMIMFTKPTSNEAWGWLPSDCDGTFPTGNPPNYFLYSINGASPHLGLWEFHVDWVTTANSTFANFTTIPINAYTANITGIRQPNTTVKVDPLNDRMMYRLQYRSFAGYSTMVCNFTVDISTTVAGIRWYELRKSGGAWSIYQQATYAPSDNNSRWMGSIAMDSSGNMALGYSVSGTSLYPSIRYTGRKKNDALNQMTIAEKGIINGGGSATEATYHRWGDYSALSCDPVERGTYWYTQEYFATTSSTGWKTRIASFKWNNPPTVTTMAATGVTCTVATLNGSVCPNGAVTNYHFEWGTTTAYGFNTTITSAGTGYAVTNVSAPIAGLVNGTTYHFRLVAVSSDGTTNGSDLTLIPCAAAVATNAATVITMTSATSGGNVTTDGGSPVTARGVCWSTSANPVASGNHTTDGSGLGTYVSLITGLTANTLYHIRAYATNGNGTFYGNDLTFTTQCMVSTLPFSEAFATTSIPGCWSQVDHQGNGQIWQFGVITNQTPNPNLTGNYAFLNSGGYGAGTTQNADLVSPVIDCSVFTNVTLQFNHYFKAYSGSSGTLSYSNDGGTTWNTLQAFTTTSATNPAAFSMVVPGAAGKAQVNFRWTYIGTFAYSWAFDDVSVSGTSTNTLGVLPSNQNVPATPAGSTAFTVTSNTSWNASSNQSWCTVTLSGSGNGTITATYPVNTLITPRVATITATASGAPTATVTVTQAGATPTLTVTPANQSVPYTPAGSASFALTSNTTWTAVSNQTWCTVTPSGTGNGTVTASYIENTTTIPRTANITVTVATLTPIVVTVTQGAYPLLTILPAQQAVSYAPAGTAVYAVTSNTSWVVSSNASWCTVTPPSSSGNGSISATYTVNPDLVTRTATITGTATGLAPISVTLIQDPALPTLTIQPSNQTVPASPPSSTSFSVNSNTSWTIVSDQTWCTVNSSGSGNGTITANYTENTATYDRVANITVTAPGVGPVVVTVTQAGTQPTLSVDPSNRNVPYLPGITTFTVSSNSPWIAVTDSSWLTITTSGVGNGTINAEFTENPYYTSRVAAVTVTVNGIPTQTVTVTQAQSTVSIHETSASSIQLIPNPSKGAFRVETGDLKYKSLEISIMDLGGRIITSRVCHEKSDLQFDLSNVQKGSYLVKIKMDNTEVTQKLIMNQ